MSGTGAQDASSPQILPAQDGCLPLSPPDVADVSGKKKRRRRRSAKRKTEPVADVAGSPRDVVDIDIESRESQIIHDLQKAIHAHIDQLENPQHVFEDYNFGGDIVSQFYAEEGASDQVFGESLVNNTGIREPLLPADVNGDVGDTEDHPSETITAAEPKDALSTSSGKRRTRRGSRKPGSQRKGAARATAPEDGNDSGVGIQDSEPEVRVPDSCNDSGVNGDPGQPPEQTHEVQEPLPGSCAPSSKDMDRGRKYAGINGRVPRDSYEQSVGDSQGRNRERARSENMITNAPVFEDLWSSLESKKSMLRIQQREQPAWNPLYFVDSLVDKDGADYVRNLAGMLNMRVGGTDDIEEFFVRTKRRAACERSGNSKEKPVEQKSLRANGKVEFNINGELGEESGFGGYTYSKDDIKKLRVGNLVDYRSISSRWQKLPSKKPDKAKKTKKAKKADKLSKADKAKKAEDAKNANQMKNSHEAQMPDKADKPKSKSAKVKELEKLGYDKKGRPINSLFGKPVAHGNKGFDMLRKMGWKEGEGLGVKSKGMVEPLALNLRQHSQYGIGRTAGKKGDGECDDKQPDESPVGVANTAEESKERRNRKSRSRRRGQRESPAHVFEAPHTAADIDIVSQFYAGDETFSVAVDDDLSSLE